MITPSNDAAIAARLSRVLARSTASYVPLRVDGATAGWVTPARAMRLAQFAEVFVHTECCLEFAAPLSNAAARTTALERVTCELAEEGALSAWRDERYAIRPTLAAAPWFLLERAAARYFGVHSWAVHGNGLVAAASRMWLARRSPTKAIDPGMLDNLVGGGVPAGLDPPSAFVKEAWEEAGLPTPIARDALRTSTLTVRRDTRDGLQWETIAVYDIKLTPDFVPANQDGEAVEHRCVTLTEAAQLIALDHGSDQVTPDASLVILDCLLRHGAIAIDGAAAAMLATMGSEAS